MVLIIVILAKFLTNPPAWLLLHDTMSLFDVSNRAELQ